jgi:FtsZ-interacting cell division protein YlmF
MYSAPNDQDEMDEQNSGGGLRSQIGRWWEKVQGRSYDDDTEAYEEDPAPVSITPERSAIKGSITLQTIENFADTQKVADRLKAGEPQVVNLEKTTPDVAERLIDFLNGVTYALDGYVEKVAEGAYLFTPSHIAIHAEGPQPPQANPFFDRI